MTSEPHYFSRIFLNYAIIDLISAADEDRHCVVILQDGEGIVNKGSDIFHLVKPLNKLPDCILYL